MVQLRQNNIVRQLEAAVHIEGEADARFQPSLAQELIGERDIFEVPVPVGFGVKTIFS